MKSPYPVMSEHLKHCRDPWALVVEDDPDLRWATLLLVQEKDVKALGAADGVEALRILFVALHEDNMPFVLFLDLNMPVFNGWEILYLFEVAQPKLRDVPIVITSGETQTLFDLKPNIRLLKKPYSDENLFAEIDRTLKRK